jgi:uncharacterized protein YgbK (DUF1537 family)
MMILFTPGTLRTAARKGTAKRQVQIPRSRRICYLRLMSKVLVIADDLSGATDVGAQFGQMGINSLVCRSFERTGANNSHSLERLFGKCDVLLIDTQSRHIKPELAAERVHQLAVEGLRLKLDLIFKKTDSTLRGNIGAELDAFMEASGSQTLPFIPAHPTLGRITREGIHYVHGKPLAESSFANDPRSPMRESNVLKIIQKQTSRAAKLIGLNQRLDFASDAAGKIVVFDVETSADLQQTAQIINDAGFLKHIAGSAAFARCLPHFLKFTPVTHPPPLFKQPLLVLNGSLNDCAFRQCRAAIGDGFHSVQLRPGDLLGANTEDIFARIAELLSRGCDTLVRTSLSNSERAAFAKAAGHLDDPPPPAQLAERIAQAHGIFVKGLLRFLKRTEIAMEWPLSLFIIGGDTLEAIAAANNWPGFVPRAELMPGVALCELLENQELILAVKPGGFGKDDLLVEVARNARNFNPR